MIHQENFQQDKIYRFELMPNTSANAYGKAFNLYGILIIPILLGSFLMYNVFGLTGKYFTSAFLLMVFLLGNIYFFYHRMDNRVSILKLIIYSNNIQILDQDQIYFQEDIKEIDVEIMSCGTPSKPAVRISHENFQGIIIGWKKAENSDSPDNENKLRQPDYLLRDKSQSNILMNALQNSIEMT